MIELTEEAVAALERQAVDLTLWVSSQERETIVSLCSHWRATQPNMVKICRYCHRVRSDHWGVNAHCDSDCLPTKTVFTPLLQHHFHAEEPHN